MERPIPGAQSATTFDAAGGRARLFANVRYAARKVPEVTIFFWLIKLLSTALGESTSDYLVHTIRPEVAVVLGGIAFVIALALQLAVRSYVAWVYWLTVVMVAVFGTMVADVVHIVLGVPYEVSAACFAVALAVIFIVWYRVERTLSIHTIETRRRELFYWATVVTTFALGTAVGDMTAYSLNLGFLASGIFFAVLFFLPGLAYWLLRLNSIVAFWFAYIVTRPLGASFADLFGKEKQFGGLGIGSGLVSLVLLATIVVLVAYLSVSRVDVKDAASAPRG